MGAPSLTDRAVALSHAKRGLAMADTYRRVFSGEDGETVLHDLMRRGGLLEVSAVEGDSYATHFRDGRRALALEIVEQLRFTEADVLRLALRRSAVDIEEG